jgi:hypothetical protein
MLKEFLKLEDHSRPNIMAAMNHSLPETPNNHMVMAII